MFAERKYWKKQLLGDPQCPYIHRWLLLNLYFFSIRFHHFLRSDDNRALHDHSGWYVTILLWGEYDDVSDEGTVKLRAPSIAFRRATHRHTVRTRGVWTLFILGRETRVWGFWPEGRFKRREKYFKRFGHHPCDQP